MQEPTLLPILLLIFSLVWIALFCAFSWLVLFPWMHAQSAGRPVALGHVLRMRLKGLPAGLILDAYARLVREGSATSLDQVEEVYRLHRQAVRTAEDLVRLVRDPATKV